MRNIQLGSSGVMVPTIAVGCMRIVGLDAKRAEHFLKTALENGANFFDHADCYSGGRCEELFADALHMGCIIFLRIIFWKQWREASGA